MIIFLIYCKSTRWSWAGYVNYDYLCCFFHDSDDAKRYIDSHDPSQLFIKELYVSPEELLWEHVSYYTDREEIQ